MSDWSYAGPPITGPQPPTLWDRLQGLGSSLAQWYAQQPSWIDQARAVKQGSDWRTLNPTDAQIDFATGLAGPTALGIKAFHGSPYDFNKFDMSKIGTGEGAQAYGHGLYFAEAEPTAQSYRDALTNRMDERFSLGGQEINQRDLAKKIAGDIGANTDYGPFVVLRDMAAGRDIQEIRKGNPTSGNFQKAIDWVENNKVEHVPQDRSGRMYEVNINADPEHFLDWDKPLSEQSDKVRNSIMNNERIASMGAPSDIQHLTGANVYEFLKPRELMDKFSNNYPLMAAEQLREAGIPGIKYLDQGSRNLGDVAELESKVSKLQSSLQNMKPSDPLYKSSAQALTDYQNRLEQARRGGTSNYVVFDDKLIDIVKKYGWAAIAALTGANIAPPNNQPKPLGM